jgi:hypothetical protein
MMMPTPTSQSRTSIARFGASEADIEMSTIVAVLSLTQRLWGSLVAVGAGDIGAR